MNQGHQVWSKSSQRWCPAKIRPHPKLKVRISVSKKEYKLWGLPAPACHEAREMEALVDTGAMMVVQHETEELGVWEEELVHTSVTIQVLNGFTEPALGMILVVISCQHEAGVLRSFQQQACPMRGAGQHQKLPLINGSPPLRLHLDELLKPVSCHRAGNIPQHFVDQAKADLDRDVRLVVLRKIPDNTPLDAFLSRMGVVTKKSGKPSRMVDYFKALNRA